MLLDQANIQLYVGLVSMAFVVLKIDILLESQGFV